MNTVAASGNIFAHKYQLLRKLGQGGMGVVWEAEHVTLGLRVALKLLDPSVSQHPDIHDRFLKEARAAAALQCAHVVRVFDHDNFDGKPFIVMEKLEGETLAERLEREGPLGPRQTFRIVEQLCIALSRAHEAGIIHRDIKPSNVFLARVEGQREVVKVLDFGIAKHLGSARTTDPPTGCGIVMGTPWYMSPEQAKGERPIDSGTDLWATGVLTYECLTGRRPFEQESFRELVDAICTSPHPSAGLLGPCAESFDLWFQRATARERGRRFRSASQLVAALRKALDLGGALHEPDTSPSRRRYIAALRAKPPGSAPIEADPVQRDSVRRDSVQRESAQHDAVQGDALDGDASRRDALRGDALRGDDHWLDAQVRESRVLGDGGFLRGAAESDAPTTLSADSFGEQLHREEQRGKRGLTVLLSAGLLGSAFAIAAMREEPELPTSRAVVERSSPSSATARASLGPLELANAAASLVPERRREPRVVPASIASSTGARVPDESIAATSSPPNADPRTAAVRSTRPHDPDPQHAAAGVTAAGVTGTRNTGAHAADAPVAAARAQRAIPRSESTTTRVEAHAATQREPKETKTKPNTPRQRGTKVDLGI